MFSAAVKFGKKHPCIAVFLVSMLVFSIGTAGTEINKLDVRFALFLKDFEWDHIGVFPKLGGWDYPDYFVTWTLFSMLTTLGGRFVNLWTLALPTMLAGSAMIALTYRMGEEIRPRMGLYSAGLLLTVSELYFCICGFGLDVPVALFGTLMLCRLQKAPEKLKTHLLFGFLVILSFLVRGSLGLIVFGAAAAGWLLAGRHWKQVLTYGITGGIASCLGVGMVVILIWIQGGESLWEWFLDWQVRKRVGGGDYFFYFTNGFFAFAPLTFFSVIGMYAAGKKLKSSPFSEWIGYILLPILILSLPGGQHKRYILYSLPPLALFGGWGITELAGKIPETCRTAGTQIIRFLPVPGLIAMAVIAAVSFFMRPEAVPLVPYAAGALLFILLFLCRKSFSGTGVFVLFILCGALIFAALVLPFNGLRENNRKFAVETEAGRNGILWFLGMGPDHEDLKYCLYVPRKARKSICFLSVDPPVLKDSYNAMFERYVLEDTVEMIRPEDLIIVKSRDDRSELEQKAKEAGLNAVVLRNGNLGHNRVWLMQLRQR